MAQEGGCVIGIGNAVVDLVLTVSHHPGPDEEMRAASRDVRIGGNTANMLRVLANGPVCRACWIGTLGDDTDGDVLARRLADQGVVLFPHRGSNSASPLSVVLLQAGSRSIVHHRQLDELALPAATSLLAEAATQHSPCRWLHVEGRDNARVLSRLLAAVRAGSIPGVPCDVQVSLELEKPRPGLLLAMMNPPLVQVILTCRAYALAVGMASPSLLLQHLHRSLGVPADVCVIITWADDGAFVWTEGNLVHVPASIPAGYTEQDVVDTLAAGDTFLAGVIEAWCLGHRPILRCVEYASHLAGAKVVQHGVQGIPRPQMEIDL